MALETPLLLEAVTGDTPITFSARQIRTLIDTFAYYEGVVGDGDLKVVQRAAGANMSVDVAVGTVAIRGDAIAYQGKYLMRSTSVVNVPVATSPSSGTRTDLIAAQLYDKQADGQSQYGWNIVPIAGPAGGTAALPGSAVPLAYVQLSAGQASVQTVNITDARYFAASFTNVQLVPNAAGRPSTPRSGDQVYQRDVGLLNLWNGSGWVQYTPTLSDVFYAPTDANGYLVVSHNLGHAPVVVLATIMTNQVGGGAAIPSQVIVDFASLTSTTFRVRVIDATGAPYNSTAVQIAYTIR